MNALILAGGLGTRLRSVVGDVPKPMAEVNSRPFLEYILNWLNSCGVKKTVLAVGYKSEVIQNHFGIRYEGMDIIYSQEKSPLGTGGAIMQGLKFFKGHDYPVFVVNGDTFFDVDLNHMLKTHTYYKNTITIAIKEMRNYSRFGTLEVNENQVISFSEKMFKKKGFINGGVYLIDKKIINMFPENPKFSFERDILEEKVAEIPMTSYLSSSSFIDIGIPEDYRLAQDIFNDDKKSIIS